MIKEAKATGATIEEAQQAAVLALDAPLTADVQVEIITFPEKKKFGLFGGKLAEVRAYYEVPDQPEKKPVSDQKQSNKPKAEKKPAEKAAPKAKKKPVEKKDAPKAEKKPVEKKDAPKAEKEVVEKPAPTPIALEECPDSVKKAYQYLLTIAEGIGVAGIQVAISHTEKEYFFSISSEEDYSLLIGRRGETLDSIQYLVRLAANHGKEEGKFAKISINVGNYRQKRENTLKEIARKNGKRVRKYGRKVTLEPMNPFERRIIHTAISEMEGLQSFSIGSDADRRVVIALEDGVEPLNPQGNRNNNRRGGYNNRRGGNRNGGNRNRSSRDEVPSAPTRAPRADSAGVLYGKIEARAPKAEVAEPVVEATESTTSTEE